MTDRDAYITRRVASFVYLDGAVERSALGERVGHAELMERLGHREDAVDNSSVLCGVIVTRAGKHWAELLLDNSEAEPEVRGAIENAFPELDLEAEDEDEWSLG